MRRIGLKAIATKTSLVWGYVEGDLLEIRWMDHNGVFEARNLTHPHLTAERNAFICEREFEFAPTHEWVETERYTYAIFGIPIYRRTIKEKRAI